MAEARTALDWKKMTELSINPEKVKVMRDECAPKDKNACSMCDRFCSLKIMKSLREEK